MNSPEHSTEIQDSRHEEIMRLFPGGLTPAQFRRLTLESADEDDKVDPPSLADWFSAMSLLIGMQLEGLIDRRCRKDESGQWFITPKGRAAITKALGST